MKIQDIITENQQGVAEGILGDREYNRVMPVVKRIASEVSDYDRDEFGEELWSLLDQKYGSKFAQSVLQDSLGFYWDEYTELAGQQGVTEGSFNKCFDKACKLYDKAVEKDLNPILYQVADYKGDGSDADSRWAKLPQHVWSHYVTVIGDTVYDPTAKQFGPDKSEKYNINQLEKEWGKIYKIRPKQQGVREGLDPYRLERLDPQTRRVLTRMGDHKEPGSWLSASEAYAMSLGLQYKNRDPRGWEQEVQRYVDLYRQYSGQGVQEVKILSKVKNKGSESQSQLPRFGRPIGPGEETHYLGTKVADWQGREIWRDYLGGQLSYHLFDPDTRTVIVTTFGSRYKMNPRSYIIHGLYAAPGNPVGAAEFYRGLVRDLGLTLISDRKQSPGGNRVWQQLEQFPDVEVYGYDTATDQALNFGAGDVEMYTVPSAAVAGSREMQRVARDLRLVATTRSQR